MREIEVKACVADKNDLLKVLKRQGVVLSEPVTQRDQVFGVAGVDGGGDNNSPWLRIRTETKNGVKKQIFTLKKSITNQLDSIEHETEVSNEDELAKIIEHIGFTLYSDLTKTRQKAMMGEIELCVDSIDELGDFIEAEKLTADDVDYIAVSNELWSVLEGMGVDRVNEVTDGYDVLMNKKLAGKN